MANEEIEKTQTEVQNEEVKEVTPENTQKVYTEEEVKNLLSAKNHEKEARQALQSELNELKQKFAKLSGDEAVEKFNQEKFNQLQTEFDQLKATNEKLLQEQEDNQFKDALRKVKGLLPEAVDDVLNRAKARGFKKTELGYLDSNGKTVEDFIKDLKSSNSYYFGISSNHNLVNQQFRDKVDKDAKSRNTLNILQGAFQNTNFRELAMHK